jgi:hypothetical protein
LLVNSDMALYQPGSLIWRHCAPQTASARCIHHNSAVPVVEMTMINLPPNELSQRARQAAPPAERSIRPPMGGWASSVLYILAGVLVVAGALTLAVESLQAATLPAVLIGAACGLLAYVIEVLSRIEYDLRMQNELTRQMMQRMQQSLTEFSGAAESRAERNLQAAERSTSTLTELLEAASYNNELMMHLINRATRPAGAQSTQETSATRKPPPSSPK